MHTVYSILPHSICLSVRDRKGSAESERRIHQPPHPQEAGATRGGPPHESLPLPLSVCRTSNLQNDDRRVMHGVNKDTRVPFRPPIALATLTMIFRVITTELVGNTGPFHRRMAQ